MQTQHKFFDPSLSQTLRNISSFRGVESSVLLPQDNGTVIVMICRVESAVEDNVKRGSHTNRH